MNQIKAFEIISQRSEFLHEKVSEMKTPGTLWRYKMNKVYEIINKTITTSDIWNLDNIDYTESVIQASVSDFNESKIKIIIYSPSNDWWDKVHPYQSNLLEENQR